MRTDNVLFGSLRREGAIRTGIATVCLSGDLVEKLHACAAAGFDGVEIFEPDLVVSASAPEEIRALADRLGLTLDLYQPFRDFEGVSAPLLADNLRRAEAKFALMRRLGVDLILVCSNVGTATEDSEAVSAAQLRRLGELAADHGVRVAFEALAWGRFVHDYATAWRIVERADHPGVGLCLDSFHILSRGHDPAGIEQIPGDRIFFVQLADAPALSMDVLSWSRHHRLFPGEGAWDLGAFVGHVLRTGYDGPLSLEVFNDTFRQTDVAQTAAHARRSLVWLEDQVLRQPSEGHRLPPARVRDGGLRRLPAAPQPTGLDFVEIKAEDTSAVERVLGQLGLVFRGQHRTKPVRLWSAGDARVILNEQYARDQAPHLAAVGIDVADPAQTVARARVLKAPPVYRRTYAEEVPLEAVRAPDGTEVFLCASPDPGAEPRWTQEFERGVPGDGGAAPQRVDHVNLVYDWQQIDEAVLFYMSVLDLDASVTVEVAGPTGLVRSQVMRTADGAIRMPLNVAPPVLVGTGLPRHVAFATDRIEAVARQARDRGLEFLPVPDNYYDDLVARFALDDDTVGRLRELGLLYDREGEAEFVHFYTATIGGIFFEVVERRRGYDGYGAANAPIRLAAQRHRRLDRLVRT